MTHTALITGGAVRIGAEIAKHLARTGMNICIHYRSSEAEAKALCDKIQNLGVEAWTMQADLSEPSGVDELLDQAFSSPLKPNILINNASNFVKTALQDTDQAVLMRNFQSNFFAPFLLMRGFAQRVESGAVVNLLDRRITSHDASCAAYVLAKKALAEATRMAAIDYAPKLRVNAVAPGPVLPPPCENESYLRDKAGPLLVKRPKPADIADAVLYLLQAPAITGQILFVDGGQHLLAN